MPRAAEEWSGFPAGIQSQTKAVDLIVATYDVAAVAALSIFDERKTCLKTRREGERMYIQCNYCFQREEYRENRSSQLGSTKYKREIIYPKKECCT